MDGPFASLWVKTSPQANCAVCGPARVRPTAPVEAVAVPDDLDALLDELTSMADGSDVEPDVQSDPGSVLTRGTHPTERH